MTTAALSPFYHNWQFWFQTLQLIGIVIIGIYTWWTNREKVNASRFDLLEKEVSKRVTDTDLKTLKAERDARCALHQERTGRLEIAVSCNRADINNLPGYPKIDELHSRVTNVQGQLKEVNGRLQGIGHTVDLIQEHLIRGGKS